MACIYESKKIATGHKVRTRRVTDYQDLNGSHVALQQE